ncbi:hypothetical protein SETIT_2G053900v2 [Setaria italica]|uniref:Uncharacterized protein n=1 Tax=Setaria italica TaxID=4555 RepID=A0A368PVR3_SETIT|nr:hypothetical protein SETIT_2G053900v2 [Setaria italica]
MAACPSTSTITQGPFECTCRQRPPLICGPESAADVAHFPAAAANLVGVPTLPYKAANTLPTSHITAQQQQKQVRKPRRFPARLPAACLAPRRRAPLVVEAAQTEDAETSSTAATPKPAARSPGLWAALAFSGPAPERINERLAMVGFVSVLPVEAARGDGLLTQAGNSGGLTWFTYTAVVLSVASLAPLLQGESVKGRSALERALTMLGLVAFTATEYLTGTPFVHA